MVPDSAPITYKVVRSTWLSRKPAPRARTLAMGSLLALALGTAIYWRDPFGLGALMPASGGQVFVAHQFWRLWTTLFAHADLGHFAANSLLFVGLGYFLSGYYGALVFPLTAFLFGGLTNLLALATYPLDVKLIGASGIVSWMGGAWLVLYVFLNRKISLIQRLMRAFGVGLVLFAPSETFDPHISYRTHLIGFTLGVFWGVIYYASRRKAFRAAEVVETITEDFNTGPLDSPRYH